MRGIKTVYKTIILSVLHATLISYNLGNIGRSCCINTLYIEADCCMTTGEKSQLYLFECFFQYENRLQETSNSASLEIDYFAKISIRFSADVQLLLTAAQSTADFSCMVYSEVFVLRNFCMRICRCRISFCTSKRFETHFHA